jgi:hypothetical protein
MLRRPPVEPESAEAFMWYHELENRVVPAAYAAASRACSHVQHVELRLEHGSIIVVVRNRPTVEENKKCRAPVKRALRGIAAETAKLKIFVRPVVLDRLERLVSASPTAAVLS